NIPLLRRLSAISVQLSELIWAKGLWGCHGILTKLKWFKTIYNQFHKMFGMGKEEDSVSSFSDFHPSSALKFTKEAWVKQYEGKLLLRQEINLPEPTFKHYVNLQYFQAVPSITKTFPSRQCVRCFNRDEKYFASINCKRCHSTHVYCRHCIEMGRILDCEPL